MEKIEKLIRHIDEAIEDDVCSPLSGARWVCMLKEINDDVERMIARRDAALRKAFDAYGIEFEVEKEDWVPKSDDWNQEGT